MSAERPVSTGEMIYYYDEALIHSYLRRQRGLMNTYREALRPLIVEQVSKLALRSLDKFVITDDGEWITKKEFQHHTSVSST